MIVLVQCTATKREQRSVARELYAASSYFCAMRKYAEAKGDAWFILSAEHGLITPDTELDPYNTWIGDVDTEEWAAGVREELETYVGAGETVELVAGKKYADPLQDALADSDFVVVEPFEGLRIGKRKAALKTAYRELVNQTLDT